MTTRHPSADSSCDAAPARASPRNLKYFNKKILNYSLKQENDFLLDILLKSPQNSVFLDIGAYNRDTSIYISKKLKEKNRIDILVLAFEPNKKYSKLINQRSKTDNLNLKCITSGTCPMLRICLYGKYVYGRRLLHQTTLKLEFAKSICTGYRPLAIKGDYCARQAS